MPRLDLLAPLCHLAAPALRQGFLPLPHIHTYSAPKSPITIPPSGAKHDEAE